SGRGRWEHSRRHHQRRRRLLHRKRTRWGTHHTCPTNRLPCRGTERDGDRRFGYPGRLHYLSIGLTTLAGSGNRYGRRRREANRRQLHHPDRRGGADREQLHHDGLGDTPGEESGSDDPSRFWRVRHGGRDPYSWSELAEWLPAGRVHRWRPVQHLGPGRLLGDGRWYAGTGSVIPGYVCPQLAEPERHRIDRDHQGTRGLHAVWG